LSERERQRERECQREKEEPRGKKDGKSEEGLAEETHKRRGDG